jgi:2-isopropylmalate synthase
VRIKDKTKQATASGDGPVDAAYEAIRKATGHKPELENYSIRAVTKGKEALGEATVKITDNGKNYTGRGISTDIIEASAKAYVDAINRLVSANKGKDQKPELKAEL